MTTIGEFINKNINIFEKASSLEYLVFGVFPKDFLDKPINVSVSQKKGGLILSINDGKLVIMVNNFINSKKGGKKSKKNIKKSRSRKTKRIKRKAQKGGNLITGLLVIILAVYLAQLSPSWNLKQLAVGRSGQLEVNPWEVDTIDIKKLFSKVKPTLKITNKNISMSTLKDSLTRALTSNNTEQIIDLPRNMTLKPLSYAEFNISRFPAHTEMVNMFKNISFTNRTFGLFGPSTVFYRIFGNWRISNNGAVNIELFDPIMDPFVQRAAFRFPNRRDVEERILNFVTETIQIQKKIGMIRKNENEGQFRLGLSNAPPNILPDDIPLIHYDEGIVLDRTISEKAYTRRNPEIGGIISLIYPEATEISQPSITIDNDGNPIPDPLQIPKPAFPLNYSATKTKYIEGTPTTGQVQMHDQSQSVRHEGVGKKMVRRRILNLQILPGIIEHAPLRADKRTLADKGGRKKKKSRRKKKTRKKRKK